MWARPKALSTNLPRGFVNALRLARTAAFRLITLPDLAYRHARGRGHLPPLWLRRHAGPIGAFESSAAETLGIIERLQLVRAGDNVVDIGCGPGAMAHGLRTLIGDEGHYLGIDVHRPSILWCRHRFREYPGLKFDLVPSMLPSLASAEPYQLPVVDSSVDFVLAKSLFTHLRESEIRFYLAEIIRCLRPGGRAMITAFLFANAAEAVPAFRFSNASGLVRWRVKHRPEAATAFDRDFFAALVAEAGLELPWIEPGFWPGTKGVPAGQDIAFLRKPIDTLSRPI